ncbi:hypothetical protein [Algoriphagus sp.]|jgi:hypothetical protein|uniref:hypothetical protein n=1 Tax=Algoriphagus sp. TaxID=1872435 RepID=UPI00261AC44B|nr:hypothetical protein [Algoriphagus sp.]
MDNQIEIYQGRDGQTQIEVKFEKDTVWLNRNQIASLFGRDVKTIGKHINNVFNEGELVKEVVVAKFATTTLVHRDHEILYFDLYSNNKSSI